MKNNEETKKAEKAVEIQEQWKKELNLTDQEVKLFLDAVRVDKEVLMLFCKARIGDSNAVELLKKILNT